MMRLRHLALIGLFIFLITTKISAEEKLNWFINVETAKSEAKAQKKYIFMLFTGSDWCYWCKKLERQILSKKEFSKQLGDKMIFMFVDFPVNLPQDHKTKRQNQKLKNQFNIRGFPTILLLDSDFYPIQLLGYQEVPPKEFAEIVWEQITEYENLTGSVNQVLDPESGMQLSSHELQNLFQTIQEFKREDWKDGLIELGLKMEDNLFFLLEQYQTLAEKDALESRQAHAVKQQIKEKDMDNSLGSLFRIALIDFQDRIDHSKDTDKDIENSLKPLIDYSSKFGKKDKEHGWRVNMMISEMLSNIAKHQKALEYAKDAQRIAPDMMQAEINRAIDDLKKQVKGTSENSDVAEAANTASL